MAHCLEHLWGAYLFDLDGTLIDTAPDLHRALNHALDEFGFAHVEESLARRFIGHGALVMIERAISHQEAQHSDPAELLDVFLGYYAEHICDASVAYPEVADTLAELRSRGARVGHFEGAYVAITRPEDGPADVSSAARPAAPARRSS